MKPSARTPSAEDPGDRRIVARVLSGDEDCFHELVRRHGAPIWAGLRGLLANREDAREVFQETFLRAFERLGTLRETARLRSWLLSIALNLARERLRRAGRRAAGEARLEAEADEHAPPASEPAERDELAALLRREVAALPPRQREVVELRMNAELSHAEIAAALGITEESSRASHYQALRRLRARLGAATDEEPRDPGAKR